MISPVGNVDSCKPLFRGRINNSEVLNKALKNLSEKDYAEFLALREKASKVDDGRVFSFFNSKRYGRNAKGEITSVSRGFGLMESGKGTISNNVYSFEHNGKVRIEDERALFKTLIEPLRKIYG